MSKITGTNGADILNGTNGNDIIDGGAGADIMTGGLGHDRYYVDNVLDQIFELLGEGTDEVYSSVSYTLPANVENLTLTGKDDINAFGNDWDNVLRGNRGDNILNGGAGTDMMYGGKGNDTYIINQFNQSGINSDGRTDTIIDTGGHDTVMMLGAGGPESGKYIMQKGLEDLAFFTPDINWTITGNKSKNNIRTSDGDDIIDGGKGADTMDGGDGANTYYVDHKKDVIIDTFDDTADEDKMDTAYITAKSYVMSPTAHVEKIIISGNSASKVTGSDTDNHITGNAKKNTIRGGGGDDVITGGGGKDILWGDAGADEFYFDPETAFKGPVRIMDFNPAQGDKLNIADILEGYTNGIILSAFVEITDKGRDSIVKVNVDGNGTDFIHIATLHRINGLTGEDALELAGTLITLTTP